MFCGEKRGDKIKSLESYSNRVGCIFFFLELVFL